MVEESEDGPAATSNGDERDYRAVLETKSDAKADTFWQRRMGHGTGVFQTPAGVWMQRLWAGDRQPAVLMIVALMALAFAAGRSIGYRSLQ